MFLVRRCELRVVAVLELEVRCLEIRNLREWDVSRQGSKERHCEYLAGVIEVAIEGCSKLGRKNDANANGTPSACSYGSNFAMYDSPKICARALIAVWSHCEESELAAG